MSGIIVFLFGALIGSFLNVVISRVPKNESVVFPGSHCPKCKRAIKAYENIPILSYIVLQGKCSGCSEKISIIYPLVEFLTAINFYLVYWNYGLSVEAGVYAITSAILIVIFFIDLKHYIIPDNAVVGIGILAIVQIFTTKQISFLNAALSTVITFLFFYLIFVLSKGKFGGGDVKLLTALALFFGWPYINILIIVSSLSALLVGTILIMSGKMEKNDPIPFGPYIVFSALIIIINGDFIWGVYEKIITALLL